MHGEARNYETQVAEYILNEFGITTRDKLPVDMDAILAAKGFTVSERDLPEDLAAVLDTRTAGKPILLVDRHLDLPKKRFVKACELGHFLLDGDFTGVRMDKKAFFSQALSGLSADESERRANRFAYALLMPKKILEEQAQKNNDKSDDDFASALAAVFGVSALAVAVALVISALLGDNKGKKK